MARDRAPGPQQAKCPLWVKSRHVQCKSMSASPPKADMCAALGDVRFVPIADMANFIRSLRLRAQAALGDVKAKRFGGLEVDHQLIFSRRLNRYIGRLLAFEDAINVTGR